MEAKPIRFTRNRRTRTWVVVTLAIVLDATGEAALAADDPCQDVNTVFEQGQPLGGLSGSFETRVLPGNGEAKFLIESNLASLKDQRLCGLVIWGEDEPKPLVGSPKTQEEPVDQTPGNEAPSQAKIETRTCKRGSEPGQCQWMVLLSSVEENGKTVAVFGVPTGKAGRFGADLWQPANVRVVSFEQKGGKWEPVNRFSQKVEVSSESWAKFYAILAALLIYSIAAFAARRAGKTQGWLPWHITVGIYGRASLSRLQTFVFSLLIGMLLVYTWLRTGVLWDLSEDLLLLLGISAGGTAGAKFTAVTKKQPSAKVRSYLRRKRWLPGDLDEASEAGKLRDILLTDGKLNVYKFQAVLFSLVVGFALVDSWFSGTGIVDIPESLLALMGLSQAVYVGGKAISESNIKDYETQFTELEDLEGEYRTAANNAILGGSPTPQVLPPNPSNAQLDVVKAEYQALDQPKFDLYYAAAGAARETFQDLHGIELPDAKLLPIL